MSPLETARFRAAASEQQAFGATPQEALNALMTMLPGEAAGPIVIWPYNRSDAYFSEEQQARLLELKQRRSNLSPAERAELEALVEASFDATVSRTQSLPIVKS